MENSGIGNLNLHDIVKTAVTTFSVGVIGALYATLNAPNFNVFEADWKVIVTAVLLAGVGRVAEKFFTTKDKKFLGAIQL